ncbi:PREDICTED: uncharacterized protein LOC104589400 [Nelumbo nucifera]|uniref:Uncharacterized protein LOC104589400 n=1 Tax=Nelumbo nucifera TaxID=4432 RepID=A0A1U7Z5C4_NELNU|nr:PREDICTED: uncharacterized protein LOC104589400 [Nelumbo nucifera]
MSGYPWDGNQGEVPSSSGGAWGFPEGRSLEAWEASGNLASTSRGREPDSFGPSSMSMERLQALVFHYNLPRDLIYSLPSDNYPWEHDHDEIVIFEEQLVAGLRLPLHPLIVEVLSHFNVTIDHPNSVWNLVGTISLFFEYCLPLSLDTFASILLIKNAYPGAPLERRSYYFSPRPGFKLLHELPNRIPAWKRGYFVVRNPKGWPFPTHRRAAIQDPGVDLDLKVRETLQPWAGVGFLCSDDLAEDNLVQAGLSPANMSGEDAHHLLSSNQKRRAKRLRPNQASTSEAAEFEAADPAFVPPPEVPPVSFEGVAARGGKEEEVPPQEQYPPAAQSGPIVFPRFPTEGRDEASPTSSWPRGGAGRRSVMRRSRTGPGCTLGSSPSWPQLTAWC